jgi:hypothetical protein
MVFAECLARTFSHNGQNSKVILGYTAPMANQLGQSSEAFFTNKCSFCQNISPVDLGQTFQIMEVIEK